MSLSALLARAFVPVMQPRLKDTSYPIKTSVRDAKRYRYYVSASLLAGDHPQAQKGMRVPAGDIEVLRDGHHRSLPRRADDDLPYTG